LFFFLACWDSEPDNRPTIDQVISELKTMVKKIPVFKRNYELMVDEIVEFLDKGKEKEAQHILDYLNNHNVVLQEFYHWLSNDQNKSNVIFLLGHFNYLGIGTSVDKKKAFELYQQAAKNLRNCAARYYLALMYKDGVHVDSDNDKSFELAKELTEEKYSPGIYMLGYCYHHGIGTEVDKKKAFELYQQAANLKHCAARHSLALMFKDGDFIDKDYNKSFELAEGLTEEQYSPGINMLGYCYHHGIGTEVDKKRAFELYQKAASIGNSTAQMNLVCMYKNGDGIDKNHEKAFELCKGLGDDLDGMNMLGYCYQHGIGTSVNKQKAFELYEKAADLGHSVAQFNLALMYKNGEGIDKNYDEVFELFKKSAEKRYSPGISMLGYCYHYGIGTNVNKQKAFEFYKEAADLGVSMAQYYLATLYESDKVQDQALYWYEKSAEQGYEDAIKKLSKIRTKKSIVKKGFAIMKQITNGK
jgi:uncharacterized protein